MASVFSQIVAGVIPCYKIYEDERTLAFLDIHPEVRGHVLVVPKVEVDKVYDLEGEDYMALMATVKKVAQRIEEVMGARAVMKVIGTDVPHAHVHVMPLSETWKYGETLSLSEVEMRELMEKLRFGRR